MFGVRNVHTEYVDISDISYRFRRAAEKSYFLNGRAIKETPPPRAYLQSELLFYFLFVLNCRKRILTTFFLPTIFGQKEPYFWQNIATDLLKLRLCQHCQYWYFDMSSKVKYLLFSKSNKKSFKKSIFFFNGPASIPPPPS